jgi:hypothetical protein
MNPPLLRPCTGIRGIFFDLAKPIVATMVTSIDLLIGRISRLDAFLCLEHPRPRRGFFFSANRVLIAANDRRAARAPVAPETD